MICLAFQLFFNYSKRCTPYVHLQCFADTCPMGLCNDDQLGCRGNRTKTSYDNHIVTISGRMSLIYLVSLFHALSALCAVVCAMVCAVVCACGVCCGVCFCARCGHAAVTLRSRDGHAMATLLFCCNLANCIFTPYIHVH